MTATKNQHILSQPEHVLLGLSVPAQSCWYDSLQSLFISWYWLDSFNKSHKQQNKSRLPQHVTALPGRDKLACLLCATMFAACAWPLLPSSSAVSHQCIHVDPSSSWEGPGSKENLCKYADVHAACYAVSNNVICFWPGSLLFSDNNHETLTD